MKLNVRGFGCQGKGCELCFVHSGEWLYKCVSRCGCGRSSDWRLLTGGCGWDQVWWSQCEGSARTGIALSPLPPHALSWPIPPPASARPPAHVTPCPNSPLGPSAPLPSLPCLPMWTILLLLERRGSQEACLVSWQAAKHKTSLLLWTKNWIRVNLQKLEELPKSSSTLEFALAEIKKKNCFKLKKLKCAGRWPPRALHAPLWRWTQALPQHRFTEHLLCAMCRALLGTGNRAVRKADNKPCPHGAYIPVAERKQVNKINTRAEGPTSRI